MFEVESTAQIEAPEGCMALYRVDQETFVGRKRPENSIFTAQMATDKGRVRLVNIQTILSAEKFPLTNDHQKVIGYEDPSYYPAHYTYRHEPAIMATQTYEHNGEYGTTAAGEPLASNLVYYYLKDHEPQPLITPEMLQEAGLGEHISMVKEAEFVEHNLIFEYVNNPPGNTGKRARIGIARINNEPLQDFRCFIDETMHPFYNVSTCGPMIYLDEPILFLNVSTTEREWGITTINPNTKEISPELLIRAPLASGRGYGNQRIAFGSFVEQIEDGRVAVYYHENDMSSHIAYLTPTK